MLNIFLVKHVENIHQNKFITDVVSDVLSKCPTQILDKIISSVTIIRGMDKLSYS